MRIVIGALALYLASCTPAGPGVDPTEPEGLAAAVGVIWASPATDLEVKEVGAEPSDVDAGTQFASPIDPLPTDGIETAEGRSHMGDLYARAGLIPEAIFEYQQSIEIDPSNAVRHFKLGLAYQSVRQFGEALTSYEEAARLEPDSAWAHAAVAIVHAKMGHQEKAFDAYQTVKNLDDEMAHGLLEVITQYGTFHQV
ncbi:MAG: tetratricopeptide repeat protein [Candidatus Binatia bacterium]|nr:tetratricopeptide repeat protein [Candidatus Binatia bacterium]